MAFFGLFEGVQAGEITKKDQLRLAYAKANSIDVVSTAILTSVSGFDEVTASLKNAGGIKRYENVDVGLIIAAVPVSAVYSLVDHPDVEAMLIDQPDESYIAQYSWYSATNTDLDRPSEFSSKEPKLALPLAEPYPPLADLNGLEFSENYPELDGRGVVIGHVEWWPDFLAPELKSGCLVDGERAPKFVDLVSVPSYPPSLDPTISPLQAGHEWFKLSDTVERTQIIEIEQEQFELPHDGAFRWGVYRLPEHFLYTDVHPILNEFLANDDQTSSTDWSLPFVWSEKDQVVIFDQNRNQSFADDVGYRLYVVDQSFGEFGTDDPVTPVRESIGFAVQKYDDYVAIALGVGNHPSLVVGALAASTADGGLFDGVAPCSRIITYSYDFVSARETGFGRAVTEAFIDPRNDLVLVEGFYPITGQHFHKDGLSLLSLLLDRLAQKYSKSVFVTADNAPGLGSAADVSYGDGVISVGASQSSAAVFHNFKAKVKKETGLHWVGSEGPTSDGRLKPDILAPAIPLTLSARHRLQPFSVKYLYELPAGYQVGAGTSTATPVATGIAARLISAHKSGMLAFDSSDLNKAIRASARHLSNIPIYQQGWGQIDIQNAFNWLRSTENYSAGDLDQINVIPSPEHYSSNDRAIFISRGFQLGQEKKIRLHFDVSSLSPETTLPTVSLLNDENNLFSINRELTRQLNGHAFVDITITPHSQGAFSTFIHLTPPSGRKGIRIPLTIIVPYDFRESDDFIIDRSIEIERLGRTSLFFKVPDHAEALNFQLRGAPVDNVAMLIDPVNMGFDRFLVADTDGNLDVAIASPPQGVWQLVLYNSRDSYEYDWPNRKFETLPNHQVDIRLSITGAEVAEHQISVSGEIDLSIQNNYAPIQAKLVTAVGSLNRRGLSIKENQSSVLDFSTTASLDWLIVEANDNLESGDIDLVLYQCKEENCRQFRISNSSEVSERLVIKNPGDHDWRISIINASGQCLDDVTVDVIVSDKGNRLTDSDTGTLSLEAQAYSEFTVEVTKQEDAKILAEPVMLVFAFDDQLRQPRAIQSGVRNSKWRDTHNDDDIVPILIETFGLR